MGEHLLTIHGHKVRGEDDRANHGIQFLAYKQDEDTTRAMLEQAEHEHEVDFEDDKGRKFSLVDGENGEFTVVAKEAEHGWFG